MLISEGEGAFGGETCGGGWLGVRERMMESDMLDEGVKGAAANFFAVEREFSCRECVTVGNLCVSLRRKQQLLNK